MSDPQAVRHPERRLIELECIVLEVVEGPHAELRTQITLPSIQLGISLSTLKRRMGQYGA